METPQRDSMEFDVVIIGGGPAGLSAAIRLKQLANEKGEELSVVLLEKGGELGAHILSGLVLDPKAMDELIPDWREREDKPLHTEVKTDVYRWLGHRGSLNMSWLPFPPNMTNHGCYAGSLANVCRFLGQEAENLGVDIYPGFSASEVLYDDKGAVRGVVAGVAGLTKDGTPGPNFEPGMELLGKFVLVAEGARGSLAKEIIAKYELDKDCDPQKYGIGLKEVWSVPDANAKDGYVQHTFGWPVRGRGNNGGGFLYHFRESGENFVSVGYVVHLDYTNPHLSPYDEFQQYKHHPDIACHLEGGKRVGYGARAITSGGMQSVPKLSFPGGALIGCSAGFVNLPRIKGSHNAMKTGMIGAETVFQAIQDGRESEDITELQAAYEASWVYDDLEKVRNIKPLMSRFGTFFGAVLGMPDVWLRCLLGFGYLGTWGHKKADYKYLKPAKKFKKIDYPKPDGVLSFDKLTSVSFTNTYHEDGEPGHLKVKDNGLQKISEHDMFGGPSVRYCPAGVYEWVTEGGETKFQINAQNCIHCKTCDIKDPNQNINWTVPQGGGGPSYKNM